MTHEFWWHRERLILGRCGLSGVAHRPRDVMSAGIGEVLELDSEIQVRIGACADNPRAEGKETEQARGKWRTRARRAGSGH